MLIATKTFEQFLREMHALSDREMWHLATTAVGVAGDRAQEIGDSEIEKACIQFVETMHKLAGTAPLQETSLQ